MFRLEQFRPEHLERIAATEPMLYEMLDGQTLRPEALQAAGPAYTGLVDGEPIGAAGLIQLHTRRASAWAWIGDCGAGVFMRVHRETLRALKAFRFDRIEAAVRCDFVDGHRWAQLLGFELEHPRMRKYLPDGEDAALYVRIRA